MRKSIPLLALFLITGLAACTYKMEKADLIIHNAYICSMDPANTVYQAMAVRDGRILELGAERQILNKYSAVETIDAAGKTIYPGFIDAHCHFLYYALGLREVNLVGTRSMEEVIARIEEHRKQYSGAWIIGRGWDQNDWEDKRFPDRAVLDSLYPDIPVYLSRVDGHAALANAKVLENLYRVLHGVPIRARTHDNANLNIFHSIEFY